MSIEFIRTFFAIQSIPATRFDLPKSAIGCTGYIDELKPETFPMGFHYGLDTKGRAYVAIKVHKSEVHQEGEGVDVEALREYEYDMVMVAFQRYSDRQDLWVCSEPYIVGQPLDVLQTFVAYALGKRVTEPPVPSMRPDRYMAIGL